MAEPLDPRETVCFKELLIANMIEVQALAQLLMEKGIIERTGIFDQAQAGPDGVPIEKAFVTRQIPMPSRERVGASRRPDRTGPSNLVLPLI